MTCDGRPEQGGGQTVQAAAGEPAPPLAHGVHADPQVRGDPRIVPAARGSQHDLRVQPVPVRCLRSPDAFVQSGNSPALSTTGTARSSGGDSVSGPDPTGSFAYITGVLRDGERIPLFRLRYRSSAHSFGSRSTRPPATVTNAVLRTGLPTGTPQEALDTACTVLLAEPGHEPEL